MNAESIKRAIWRAATKLRKAGDGVSARALNVLADEIAAQQKICNRRQQEEHDRRAQWEAELINETMGSPGA